MWLIVAPDPCPECYDVLGMRGWLLHGVFVLLFGGLVPWFRGLDFLDPVLIVLYFCLSFLFTAPMVSDAVAADRQHVDRAVARGAAIGWGSGLLIVALGLAVVNWTHRGAGPVLPRTTLLAGAATMSLFGCLLVAGLAAWLGLRASSAASARRTERLIVVAVLAAIAFGPRFLPASWQLWLTIHTTSPSLTRAVWYASPVLAALAAAAVWIARQSAGRRATAD